LDRIFSVALYAAVRSEVPTEGIFRRLQERGCRTYLPRVSGDLIEFVPVDDWSRLIPGHWDIPEPQEGKGVAPSSFEAVLVPGIAFDKEGYRLGYGKGFYDRCLESFRGRKIGLAYDFQVLPGIPRTKTDLNCGWMVTETRVIRGTAKEEPSWNLKL
jgi:5-formyltetrahydrofolate cyclo-ligase